VTYFPALVCVGGVQVLPKLLGAALIR